MFTTPRSITTRSGTIRSGTIRSITGRSGTALAVAALFAVASCGGSDDASTDEPVPATEAAPSDDAATGGGADADASGTDGEAPIGIGEDGQIELSDDLDTALDSLGLETTLGIAADQLDPTPEVQVDGDNARFVFSEGTLSDSWLPCTVAGAFLGDGQTLEVVYPDGSTTC